MARREVTQYFDDLDGSKLSEEEVHIVNFSVNGAEYVIDLSAANAEKLMDALKPYIEAGRKTSHGRGPKITPKYDAKAVRAWAEREGHEVSKRGKIPENIVELYLAAK